MTLPVDYTLQITRRLLIINLRSARDLLCNQFCTSTRENTSGENNAHCYDCNTLLRLIETYRK